MTIPDKTSVTPKTKGPETEVTKKENHVADDAAERASKTEHNYDEKRDIFTK
jgi:hypothetical protein